MIRQILVGLDGSAGGQSATEQGIRWASQYHAELTAVAVIDTPTICRPQMTGVGGGYYKARIERARMERAASETARFQSEFLQRCATAGVRASVQIEEGDPVEVILRLHDDHEVTLLPRTSHFRFATQDRPDETLVDVVRSSRRAIVAVPDTHTPGSSIVVAYDGSSAAIDALESFAESGLGDGVPVSVVSVAEEQNAACRRAEEAVRFLNHHNLQARPCPITTGQREADALHTAAEQAHAEMVVMGAFSHSRAREWFHRSTTLRLLRHETRLLYLRHHPE